MKSLHFLVAIAACGIGALALPAQARELDTNTGIGPEFTRTSDAIPEAMPFAQVLSPNGGEVLRPGETVSLNWNVAGRGTQAVNVWFTPDGGNTHQAIAMRLGSSGSYSWKVPNTVTREGMIRVEATDLVDVTAVDYSDTAFHISPLPAVAVSPITGEEEAVHAVVPGDFIGAPGFTNDGYYVDSTISRRPVATKEIALTYLLGDETPVVYEVSDATLSVLPVAQSLAPKPGTVLVKFEGSLAVYAAEGSAESPFLRLLPREAIAELNYGAEWKEHVMELPTMLRNSYRRGSDIVSDIGADRSIMLKPAELTALLERYGEETV